MTYKMSPWRTSHDIDAGQAGLCSSIVACQVPHRAAPAAATRRIFAQMRGDVPLESVPVPAAGRRRRAYAIRRAEGDCARGSLPKFPLHLRCGSDTLCVADTLHMLLTYEASGIDPRCKPGRCYRKHRDSESESAPSSNPLTVRSVEHRSLPGTKSGAALFKCESLRASATLRLTGVCSGRDASSVATAASAIVTREICAASATATTCRHQGALQVQRRRSAHCRARNNQFRRPDVTVWLFDI